MFNIWAMGGSMFNIWAMGGSKFNIWAMGGSMFNIWAMGGTLFNPWVWEVHGSTLTLVCLSGTSIGASVGKVHNPGHLSHQTSS